MVSSYSSHPINLEFQSAQVDADQLNAETVKDGSKTPPQGFVIIQDYSGRLRYFVVTWIESPSHETL